MLSTQISQYSRGDLIENAVSLPNGKKSSSSSSSSSSSESEEEGEGGIFKKMKKKVAEAID